jgi:hypothetical protein
MILQTVHGVKRGEFRHDAIAGDLGDDRGGGDGGTPRVAIDDGEFPAAQAGLLVAVNQAEVRLLGEALDGAAHREKTRAKNIVRLDFLNGGDADRPVDFRVAAKKMIQLRAVLGDEELGVVEMPVLQAVGQNRRRRVDRSRPASAPDFIHAGDDGDAFGAKPALEFPAERITPFAGGHGGNF